MKARYVVDTNVLIAGSSIGNAKIDATLNDPVLRQRVWRWLDNFQQSPARLVLDGEGGIEREYSRKLGFNDFGRQVVQSKWDCCAVDLVSVMYDEHGDGLLDEPLQTIVHDRADRKMVAAALEAKKQFGCCAIAFAGDTDWYGWEEALCVAGLKLEAVIEEWSRAKFRQKFAQ